MNAAVYQADGSKHLQIQFGKYRNFLCLVRTSLMAVETNPRSYTLDNTAWDGTDANGKQVADGVYDLCHSLHTNGSRS